MSTKFRKLLYKNKLKKLKQQLYDLNYESNRFVLSRLQRLEVEGRKQLLNKAIDNCKIKLNSLKECNNG